MTALMRVFIILAIGFGFSGDGMADENARPKYNVIKALDRLELREYQPAMVAQIDTVGTRRNAVSNGFMPLFRFIQGGNTANKKISMTSPVVQETNAQGNWVVSFYMPPNMAQDDVPLASDESVRVRQIPARKLVASKWYGRMSDRNIAKHTEKLMVFMADNQLNQVGPPVYAYYDGPFTPFFMREHEVLIPVE